MSSVSPGLRGIHRRLAFPPPPARPSLAVLRELNGADDDLARALFLLSRRVRDVADAPPFGVARWTGAADVRAAAANSPEIAADLLFLGGPDFELTEKTRGKAAGACHRLARWAAEPGYAELAIQLAEAAIAFLPGSARHSYEAGRLNRLFGRFGDAEALYSRAITLARPGKHWWVYVRAHLGLGKICVAKGEMDRGAAHYATAARTAADRSGEKWIAALVEHDLLILAIFLGDLTAAQRHAIRTYKWMPSHHERVPALIHDYALLLLESNDFTGAMALLEPLVMKRLPSVDMVLIWSTYARTAAALGDLSGFRRAESELASLADRFDTNAAAAYVNLGRAAHLFGLMDDATRHTARGIALARAKGIGPVLSAGESLLDLVGARRPAVASKQTDAPAHMQRLANAMLVRLAGWRGATWKRKHQAGQKRLGTV